MLKDTIGAMVGTLATSVTDIVAANGSDKDALLKRTFEEFQTAVLGKAEENDTALTEALAKVSPDGGELLFKGLGTVGRVANLLGTIADRVKCINAGVDGMWELNREKDGGSPADIDVPTEEVQIALDHLVAVAELTLRAAVNEHIDPVGDTEDVEKLAKGGEFNVVELEAADDPNMVLTVKTRLPVDLAKFAADPAALEEMALTIGMDFLDLGGIDRTQLAKMLAGDGLAKAFPPAAASTTAAPASATGAAPDDGSTTDDPEGATDDDPLMVLGRLLALCMVQLDHIQQMVDGGDDGSGGGTGDDTETGAATPGSTTTTVPTVAKSTATGDLMKINDGDTEETKLLKAEFATLKAQNDEMAAGIKKLLSQPAPVKGAAMETQTLAKNADGTIATPEAEVSPEALQKAFDALPEDERRLLLVKSAQRRPIAVP